MVSLRPQLIFILLLSLLGGVSQAAPARSLQETMDKLKTDFPLRNGEVFSLNGVNCHGTTLKAAGFFSYPTHVDFPEMMFVLNNMCTRVNGPEPGAIAMMSADRAMFSHSYYHLKSDVVVEKNDLRNMTPIRFLRRGPVAEADYYICETETPNCQDRALHQLRRRINLVGLYYGNLVSWNTATDMRPRDIFLNYLQNNVDALSRHNTTAACGVLKQLTLLRGRSILVLGRQLQGPAIFRQDSRTQSIKN